MSDRRSVNRSMFWRVLRRSMFANRGRLLVILLALGAGAAITAALLNLQVDAKRRITTEFRSFGANVMVAPRNETDTRTVHLIDEATLDEIADRYEGGEITKIGFLYVMVTAQPSSAFKAGKSSKVVLAGVTGKNVQHVLPSSYVEISDLRNESSTACRVGVKAAAELNVHPRDQLSLHTADTSNGCSVSTIESFGSSEDNEIFSSLLTAQHLADAKGKLSLIQLSVPGTPKQVERYVDALHQQYPGLEIGPIRQFTEGEARLYTRISGMLTATVAIVLILTALCVMAAMTNVAMERKNDVGLMKAIGGSMRRVLRLFLAEAALLGLAGGLIGAAVGIVISVGLGKAVFGVAAQPRLIVYPISVALTIIVAILAAYPLRRLVHIRPASVFRGEE